MSTTVRPALAVIAVLLLAPPASPGAADYFPIATDGRARCVIVRPARASPAAQAAVAALGQYLQLVTGAAIKIQSDRQPVPAGLAAIQVGDTERGRATPLGLPELRYGETRFPNLGGCLGKTLDPRTLLIRGANTKRRRMASWDF